MEDFSQFRENLLHIFFEVGGLLFHTTVTYDILRNFPLFYQMLLSHCQITLFVVLSDLFIYLKTELKIEREMEG